MLSVKIGPTSKKFKCYIDIFISHRAVDLSCFQSCLFVPVAFSVAKSPCSLAFLCIRGICDCSTEVVRSCTAVCSVEDFEALKNKKNGFQNGTVHVHLFPWTQLFFMKSIQNT